MAYEQLQFEQPTVETRASWQSSWTAIPFCYCTALEETIGGTIGYAELQYDYGRIFEGSNPAAGFVDRAPLSIGRHFVRLTWDTDDAVTRQWYGVVTSDRKDRMGYEGSSPIAPAGRQTIQVRAIEWLLTRFQVMTSVVEDSTATSGYRSILRPLVFNAGDSNERTSLRQSLGNRNNTKFPTTAPNSYIFGQSLVPGGTGTNLWTVPDIIDYLLLFQHPEQRDFSNTAGGSHATTDGPQFVLDGATSDVLAYYTPTIPTSGRTLYELINQMVDRRRGVGWRTLVDVTEEFAVIQLFSYSDVSINPPGGGPSVPGNPDTITLDVRTDVTVDSEVTVTDTQRLYEEISVIGARRGAVFTIGDGDSTMAADWTAAEETAYNNGISTSGDIAVRKSDNDTWRSAPENLRVFTRYAIEPGWDGLAGSGDGTSTKVVACPALDSNGDPTANIAPFWYASLRAGNTLPLYVGTDYSSNPAGSGFGTAQLRRTFVLLKDPTTSRWADASTLKRDWDENQNDNIANCSVRAHESLPGFHCEPGNVPHMLGGTDFTPGANGDSDVETVFGFNHIIATLYVEWDEVVAANYPAAPAAGPNHMTSTLFIRLGDQWRLDYMPAGTVLGVNASGGLIKASTGGFVRDDRKVMKDLARFAFEWYQAPRLAVNISWRKLWGNVRIGKLLTSLDGEAVNTLISNVSWNFQQGKTAIRTDFAEIDFEGLV